MSLCTAKLLSQLTAIATSNGIALDAILEALLTQNDKLNDQAVNLGEGCFNTGAPEPVVLTRIITIVDGAVTATMYLNADDTPYAGPTPIPADPCDCPCLECGETIVNGAFKTTGHQPDMVSAAAYEYDGSNSGNPSAGMNGSSYAAYKADLVSAGYVIVTSATTGNGETVVDDPLGLGLPSQAKVSTPSDTVMVDWIAV